MDGNFNRVTVFSATKAADRAALGQKVTEWLRNYEGEITGREVRQSSDNEFHCLSIILFCQDSETSGFAKRRRSNG